MLRVDIASSQPARRVTVGRLLSGAILLMMTAFIARFGFAGFVAPKAWVEASQAAALVFCLKFGETQRIASTEVILGILLGAAVGALGALLRTWAVTLLTISVAMILIHHPCPSKGQPASEVFLPNTPPSLGFWQLLLSTCWFVYRSASGSGLRGCLCAAFAHTVMLVSAAELLVVLAGPRGDWVGGDGGTEPEIDGGGVELGRGYEAAGCTGLSGGVPASISPVMWAGPGSRHGAGSPQPPGPPRRTPSSPAAALPPTSPRGTRPRRRRRSSLPQFLEGREHELGLHRLPPQVGAGVGRVGGAGGLSARASGPIAYVAEQTRLQRSASAVAAGAAWNAGDGGGGGWVSGSAGSPTAFATSVRPHPWSAGRSRPPRPVARPCPLDVEPSGPPEPESLPGGQSPDSEAWRARLAVHHQQQWEATRTGSSSDRGLVAVVPAAEAMAEGQASDCDANVGAGAIEVDLPPDESGGSGEGGGVAMRPLVGGVGDCGRTADEGDPRVGASEEGGPRRDGHLRWTGASSGQNHIPLQSNTVQGTGGPAGYGSGYEGGFSSDDDEGKAGEGDGDDGEQEEGEDDDEYDSEMYDSDDDEYEEDMDGAVSDGCFSLVIDNDGAPSSLTGGCTRGRHGRGQPSQDSAAAAVAAWVSAAAAVAAARAHGASAGGDYLAATGSGARGQVSAGDVALGAAACVLPPQGLGRPGDAHRPSSRPRRSAARHRRALAPPAGPQLPPPPRPLTKQLPLSTAVAMYPYSCDVADLADFADEDLMSLNEGEEGQVGFGVSHLGGASTRHEAAPVAGPASEAARDGDLGLLDASAKKQCSHRAAFWLSNSTLTSAVPAARGNYRPLSPGAPVRQTQGDRLRGGGPRQRSGGGRSSGSGLAGLQLAGDSAGVGAGSGWGPQQWQRLHSVGRGAAGGVEEVAVWRDYFVPLQEETLARHTAALGAHDLGRQRLPQHQPQSANGRPRGQRTSGRGEYVGGSPERGTNGAAAAGPLGWSVSAPAAAASRNLLDTFLQDAARLVRAEVLGGPLSADGCRAAGCGPHDGAAAASGPGCDLPATAEDDGAFWELPADVTAAAAVWPGGAMRRDEAVPPSDVRGRCGPSSGRRQHSGCQGVSPQPRSEAQSQMPQPGRSRCRRSCARQLSAGQLLAREVYGRYEQQYGTLQPPSDCPEYPTATAAHAGALCGHRSYRVHANGPLPQHLSHPQQSQQARRRQHHRSTKRWRGRRGAGHGEVCGAGAAGAGGDGCGPQFDDGGGPGGVFEAAPRPRALTAPQRHPQPQPSGLAVGSPEAAPPGGGGRTVPPGQSGPACDGDLLLTFGFRGTGEPPPPPPPQTHTHRHLGSFQSHHHRHQGHPQDPGCDGAPLASGGSAPRPAGGVPWGEPGGGHPQWYSLVRSSGGGWGGGVDDVGGSGGGCGAAALTGSPQQQQVLRCGASPASGHYPGPAAGAATSPTAASAPSTATVVEPFSAAGPHQAMYRSLSGSRRHEETERRWGVSDNHKAALAAAVASGSRSGPATPAGAAKPQGSPLATAVGVAAEAAGVGGLPAVRDIPRSPRELPGLKNPHQAGDAAEVEAAAAAAAAKVVVVLGPAPGDRSVSAPQRLKAGSSVGRALFADASRETLRAVSGGGAPASPAALPGGGSTTVPSAYGSAAAEAAPVATSE